PIDGLGYGPGSDDGLLVDGLDVRARDGADQLLQAYAGVVRLEIHGNVGARLEQGHRETHAGVERLEVRDFNLDQDRAAIPKPPPPHSAAGIRVDPPVSVPIPAGAKRAATPAALPPLLPPGILEVSYGLRTGPKAPLLLVMPNASSCMFALPKTMPPAPSSASTTRAFARGRLSIKLGVPAVVGSVAVLMLSLMSRGSPCRGPRP